MSIGSTEEVISALFIALDLEYISQSEFTILYEHSHKIVANINALIKRLS